MCPWAGWRLWGSRGRVGRFESLYVYQSKAPCIPWSMCGIRLLVWNPPFCSPHFALFGRSLQAAVAVTVAVSGLPIFRMRRMKTDQGLAQPPATSTHSGRQDPSLPSTSTMSVSHRHRHPTPLSISSSQSAQYSSSSLRSFSSSMAGFRNGSRGS